MDETFAAEGKARIAPQLLRDLTVRSDRAGFLQLASHMLALCATGTGLWFAWGTWWGVPFFIAHGVLINWLYAAQHEASHDTAFRTRWVNEWLGRFTGFVVMFPRDYDRWQHFCHHRHTQDPERDAELVGQGWYEGRYADLLALIGITYWGDLAATLVRHAVTGRRIPVAEYYLNDRMERQVVAEARWHLALYALIAVVSVVLESWAAVILWWAPMLATAWAHQIQNIIEHGGMPFVPDTWRNTRTIRTNPVMRWLAWQMVYHTAHHTYPGVPFHRLRELHGAVVAVRGEQPTTSTYLEHAGRLLRAAFARDGRGVAA